MIREKISVWSERRARYNDKSDTEGYDLKIEIRPIRVVMTASGLRYRRMQSGAT